ncbi:MULTISPECIES: DUF5805 domain-containing protein [unclassified Haladaptatus]|uniref:DUF5805 domain-containing protein n=1 Tax=unclassified Haladaptatus TaxID=2622732 RepID=UPI0023E832F5|nr:MULTISPECIES: DUF5805 domain-containing protein [unclassified Haladaptatus]
MTDDEVNTERTVVKAYLPAYQKEIWQEHAAELGMSQSEYVRTMVQAGRRGFESGPSEARSAPANPGGDGLETRILSLLQNGQYLSWDELVEELSGSFDDRLESALDTLQQANQIQYSGRHGGYTVSGGMNGGQ